MCETFEHIDLGDIARPYVIKALHGHEKVYGPLIRYLANFDKVSPVGARLSREEAFKLHNGCMVSYGDVLGLAGDYYADWGDLDDGVLDPQNHDVQTKLDEVHGILVAAHDTLEHKSLTSAQAARDRESEDPGGGWFAAHSPASPGGRATALAKKNDTHFPPDGFKAWRKWHELAIATVLRLRGQAAAGDALDPTLQALPAALKTPQINALVTGLKINAFADHFLTDMFSAGHMRTPRARLRSDYPMAARLVTISDILSRLQHQEDGNHGLFCRFLMGGAQDVEGTSVETWFAMGDHQFADPRNATNKKICQAAVRRSIRDVIFAALYGKYPTQVTGYWGKDPEPHATHSALQLMPEPLPASDAFVDGFDEREPQKLNHWPVAMPADGLEKRCAGLRGVITGGDYQDGELIVRTPLGTPVGAKADAFIDLRRQMQDWAQQHMEALAVSLEAAEYAYLLKLMVEHGSDYKPEAA